MGTPDFEECFRTHFARLVAIGVSMTGDEPLAHDCAQETFVRLHGRWDDVSTYDQPFAWLRKVMTNLIIDRHRSSLAERRAVSRLSRRPVDDVERSADGDDTWERLVSKLPTRQRAIVTLFYGEDLSVEQVAEALEVAPNTVKSALSKARQTLRTELEQSHVE